MNYEYGIMIDFARNFTPTLSNSIVATERELTSDELPPLSAGEGWGEVF
jgi:hypothetical protein